MAPAVSADRVILSGMEETNALEERRATVEGIPIVLVVPERRRGPLALWMSHLGGSKEQTLDMLRTLAAAGLPAVSFDAVGHGERAEDEPMELLARVMAEFRLRMWPLLALTTLDAMRVLDWAAAELGTGDEMVAGGVSMGGDVSVALAGVDDRVGRVAAAVATPDWTRPGMAALDDPSRLVDQGSGDHYSRWLREQLDPMLHLDRYLRAPPITFECGDVDTHVPPDGAERFKERLTELDPAAGARVHVHRHAGLDHVGAARSPEVMRACADFLIHPETSGS
jgi:dienelactone hydrolase